MAISDVALNPLSGPLTGAMLGYVEPLASAKKLQLDMYDFLIEPIRHKDLNEGSLFVKRFLAGPQSLWARDQRSIFSIKDLWSITDCPDEFLKYLKRIVGWTPNLDNITEGLNDATLRRLIAATAPLWKSRSTEDSISNILNLVTGNRSRVWNWFDYRWILDETALEEEHQGRDAWLIAMPGTGQEYWSTVRIVDPGVDYHQLIKDVINLMRPTGERYEIVYLGFLDTFGVDGDLSQWYVPKQLQLIGIVLPDVEDGMAKFTVSGTQAMIINSEGADDWTDRVLYARMKGEQISSPTGHGIIGMVDVATGNGYTFQLDLISNTAIIQQLANWSPSAIVGTFHFSAVGYTIQQGVWYGLRFQMSEEGIGLRMKAYVDGQEVLNVHDATPVVAKGPCGIIKNNAEADCDEFEVMRLPAISDTVEVNY
jgi:phage tail-like protein